MKLISINTHFLSQYKQICFAKLRFAVRNNKLLKSTTKSKAVELLNIDKMSENIFYFMISCVEHFGIEKNTKLLNVIDQRTDGRS